MRFLSVGGAIASLVACLGVPVHVHASDCDSEWIPYVELVGSATEVTAGSDLMRGGPQSMVCDRALEMSGQITCMSPWFEIATDTNLTWRVTGIVFMEEFAFVNTVVRWMHGGSFEIRDQGVPWSTILEGHFEGLVVMTWNMVTHTGSFVASIEMTGGTARGP